MRRPYRERLELIISELGAGVAGSGENLNDDDPPRGARPARDRPRAGDPRPQNRASADLNVNADTVVSDLAGNRRDVARWVDKANKTAQISASRRPDIAAGLKRLPGFLAELQPTMKSARAASPATRARRWPSSTRQSKNLTETLQPAGPVRRRVAPGLPHRSANASKAGDKAVKASGPTIKPAGPPSPRARPS